MPRPRRCRRVRAMPGINYFKPAGKRIIDLKEIVLSVEEYEAIKLVDFEEKGQKEAAKQMKVSQPTFHRILKQARKKVADAITNGKAIKIEGGNFSLVSKGIGGMPPGRGLRRGPGRGRNRRF